MSIFLTSGSLRQGFTGLDLPQDILDLTASAGYKQKFVSQWWSR
jgi:hypothetical protein